MYGPDTWDTGLPYACITFPVSEGTARQAASVPSRVAESARSAVHSRAVHLPAIRSEHGAPATRTARFVRLGPRPLHYRVRRCGLGNFPGRHAGMRSARDRTTTPPGERL